MKCLPNRSTSLQTSSCDQQISILRGFLKQGQPIDAFRLQKKTAVNVLFYIRFISFLSDLCNEIRHLFLEEQ